MGPSFFIVGRQLQAFVQDDIQAEDVWQINVKHGFRYQSGKSSLHQAILQRRFLSNQGTAMLRIAAGDGSQKREDGARTILQSCKMGNLTF
jgi:hypothetical protein